MNNILFSIIGGVTGSFFFLIVLYLFRKYDRELAEKTSMKEVYVVAALAFIMGGVVAILPREISWILMLSMVFMFITAFTDGHIMQIYCITCVFTGIVGFIHVMCMYGVKAYFTGTALYLTAILLMRLVKTLNTGDVELLAALSPYIYILARYFNVSYIFLIYVYIVSAFLIALILNVRKFIKERKNRFAFGVPACAAYSLMLICFVCKGGI